MTVDQLTPEQRDAAAEYGMAALVFITGSWAITPTSVWTRYRTAKANLMNALGMPSTEAPKDYPVDSPGRAA